MLASEWMSRRNAVEFVLNVQFCQDDGARGRTRTDTAKAKGFSYQLQLSLLRQFLNTHLWSGLSLYRIAEQHYEVGRSRQVSTLSLALARYEATISMLSVAA